MAVLRPGDQFAQFRLERLLGSDGGSPIWLAIDRGAGALDRLVRLHLLRAGSSGHESNTSSGLSGLDPRLVLARRMAALDSPHLVGVHGIGHDDGLAWVTTQWSSGMTLDVFRQRLDAHGQLLPASAVLEVGAQVARGLAALHEARDASGSPRPLAHGEIAACEIWLSEVRGVQLLPFGLGRPGAELSRARNHSPERWRRPNEIEPAGDLHALGCLLVELATGRPLREGSAMAEVREQAGRRQRPDDLASLAASAPALALLVARLTAADLVERPASARAVAGELVAMQAALDRPADLFEVLAWLAILDAGSARDRQGLQLHWPRSEDVDWARLRDSARRAMGEGDLAPELAPEAALDRAELGAVSVLTPREPTFFQRVSVLLGMSLSDLFTSPKTRRTRQQAAFHLRVAEQGQSSAMGGSDAAAWHEYYDELGRALIADPACFDAYWLRCHAPVRFFTALRPDRRAPRTREIARCWDAELRWLLTNFPEQASAGRSLSVARELRAEFERLCRGLERG